MCHTFRKTIPSGTDFDADTDTDIDVHTDELRSSIKNNSTKYPLPLPLRI